RLETLARLFSAIRQQSAEGMQAAIVALLKGAQQLDYDGKVELCRRINRALDDSHLAILDPETDLPARLKPMRSGGGPSTEVSYIVLRDTRRAADSRQHILRVQLTDDPQDGQQRPPRGSRIVADHIKLVPIDHTPGRTADARPASARDR